MMGEPTFGMVPIRQSLILTQRSKVSFERDVGKAIGPIEMNVCLLQRGKMLPDLFWSRGALAS